MVFPDIGKFSFKNSGFEAGLLINFDMTVLGFYLTPINYRFLH